MGRGLELATSAAQAERNLQAQQLNPAHVFNSLTGAGVPREEALAAVINPSLMRALAVKYLGPRAGGGAAGATAGAAAGSAPPQGSIAIGAPSALPLAPSVPTGSSYIHSRRMWRDGSGNLFDPQGKAVA